ncbi:MAG: trigger factor [Gammaproteobacteria bacterium]
MQVAIETTSQLGRRLIVEVPAADVKQAVNKKLEDLSKTVKMDGFRPGHVPKQVVERRFGVQAKHEAMSNVVEDSLVKVLELHQLKPAGQIDVEKLEELTDHVKITAALEIYPEITLVDWSGLQVKKPEVEITEKDIDDAIERLKDQLGVWTESTEPSKEGDKINISYTSTIDGKSYKDSDVPELNFVLGKANYLEGFEPALTGLKAGETKTFTLTYPEDWRIEELRLKEAIFVVDMKSVQNRTLAELDAEFAKKIGADPEDLSSIRVKLKENLEKERDSQIALKFKENLLEVLVAQHPMDLPKALVDRDKEEIHQNMHQQGGHQHGEVFHHDQAAIEDEARKRVAVGLLLSEVIKQYEIKLDSNKVHARILDIGRSFGNTDMVQKVYYESPQLLHRVQSAVLFDQAVEYILEKVQIEAQSMSLEDLFKG